MNTLFNILKILFGAALGAAAVLAWNWNEEREQAARGFKRGWVAIAPKPVAPPQPEKPKGTNPFLAGRDDADARAAAERARRAAAKNSAATSDAAKSAADAANAAKSAKPNPHRDDAAFARLLREGWRWPKRGSLVSAINIPITRADGSRAGEQRLNKGSELIFERVFQNGSLYVVSGGTRFAVHYSCTDFLRNAKPEGTPRPARPTTPPPAPKSSTSTPSSTARRSAPSRPVQNEQPAPTGGGAPTLFGVPIGN
jgi:hypothetical protein